MILRVKDESGKWVDIPAIIGPKGADGYTPIKGVDYFDGKDGKDGYTPVKGVDYFDGLQGLRGFKGDKGDKGDSYTLTLVDKQEIAEIVASMFIDGEEVSY